MPLPWQRPRLIQQNNEKLSVYDYALMAHHRSISELKQHRKELSEQSEIYRARKGTMKLYFPHRSVFESTFDVIAECNEYEEISKTRKRFAWIYFLKQAIPYVIWLVFLILGTD
jgi:hypothetical protein